MNAWIVLQPTLQDKMKRLFGLLIAALISAGWASAAEPVGIDKIVPSLMQLDDSWSSSHVVVWMDPLSTPSAITNANEGLRWVKVANDALQHKREAYGVMRFYHGSNSIVVVLNRYKNKKDIGKKWGIDKKTKTKLDELPKIGEEVRSYQRDGVYNNIAFRRDNYLIDVESLGAPIEKLKQLAEALDSNLVRAQKETTPGRADGARPGPGDAKK